MSQAILILVSWQVAFLRTTYDCLADHTDNQDLVEDHPAINWVGNWYAEWSFLHKETELHQQ